MTTMNVHNALAEIQKLVVEIGEACDDYGGWAGNDRDAAHAAQIGFDLQSMAIVVGLWGRQAAESSADLSDGCF